MTTTTVFISNHTQAVRLPAETRFPAGVAHVDVRVRGQQRIIAPLGHPWGSFVIDGPAVTDDLLAERAAQAQSERDVP